MLKIIKYFENDKAMLISDEAIKELIQEGSDLVVVEENRDPNNNDWDYTKYNTLWLNTETSNFFRLLDNTEDNAVWIKTTLTIDELWSMATEDKDDYLDKTVYDPQEIEWDAFNRANHTWTQDISTVTANWEALSWNEDDSTVDIILNEDVTLQVWQETLWIGRNNTWSVIPDWTVVYASWTIWMSDRITIAPYIANWTIPWMYTLWVTTEDIGIDEDWFVTHFGKVRGLDTSMFSEWDVLYASPTVAWALTNIEPEYPDVRIPLAFVVSSHSNVWTIAVRVPTVDQDASEVWYDNTVSWLTGDSVQEAIDELQAEKLSNIENESIWDLEDVDLTWIQDWDTLVWDDWEFKPWAWGWWAWWVFYDAWLSWTAKEIDWENWNIQKLEIDDDCDITFTNWQDWLTLFLQIRDGWNHTVTWDFWSKTIKWSEWTAPDLSTDWVDIVAFQTTVWDKVLWDYGLNFEE